jgi:hypothetical protein
MTGLSRETEALLERGRRGRSLEPAHRARLKAAILAKAAGASVAATVTSAAAWTSGVKILGAVVLVAVTGAGIEVATGTWKSSTASRTTTSVAPRSASESAPKTPASSPSEVTVAESSSQSDSTIELPPAAPSMRSQSMPAEPEATRRSTITATPTSIPITAARAGAVARPGSSALGVAVSSAAPQIEPTHTVTTPSSISTSPTPTAPWPSSPSVSTLEREASLLREADRAVRDGDPDRALALLDAHKASFPDSALEPERSAERVFALCRAGRNVEAQSAASLFLRMHSSGPLAARVRASCGGSMAP